MDRTHLLSDQDEVQTGPSCPAGSYADPSPEANYRATAPPADQMPVVHGHERNVIPPSYIGSPQPEAPPRAAERGFDIPAISEELAREAFTNYVSSKCCYSSKPAREMVFTDLQSLNTYRYRLETFTESRRIEWDCEPYDGQVVEGVREAPAESSIPVTVPSLFIDCIKSIRIPHISTVKGCDSCLNLGRSACSNCVNSGRTRCGNCSGTGWKLSPEPHRCDSCSGSGMISCHSCGGVGSITCGTCKGHRKLFCFMKLIVTWKNNIHVSVIDKGSGFRVELLNQISGAKLLTDMAPMVYPVVNFPDRSVNAASESAVREHQAQFCTTSRILQQRQTIELIPITRVHYTWKEKTHIYFVYGTKHDVFMKDYPAKCCCCSIL